MKAKQIKCTQSWREKHTYCAILNYCAQQTTTNTWSIVLLAKKRTKVYLWFKRFYAGFFPLTCVSYNSEVCHVCLSELRFLKLKINACIERPVDVVLFGVSVELWRYYNVSAYNILLQNVLHWNYSKRPGRGNYNFMVTDREMCKTQADKKRWRLSIKPTAIFRDTASHFQNRMDVWLLANTYYIRESSETSSDRKFEDSKVELSTYLYLLVAC